MFILKEILKAVKGRTSCKNNITFTGISTDTRTIKKGSLFIALIGDTHDGHNFINEAFRKGASAAIVSRPVNKIPRGKITIKVFDALKALQDIAHFHRNKFKAKIIAVTGSSGKTTTKDMISSVLSQAGTTLKTKENLNNEIGVPLTLLMLAKKHRFAVIEMGMQGLGEIGFLSKITSPDIAVITNTGKAHLGKLKTRKNIAKAKAEVLGYLSKTGRAILNRDDDYFDLMKRSCGKRRIVTFGIKKRADMTAENIKDDGTAVSFDLVNKDGRNKIVLPLPGKHNVYNALSAIAAAKVLGISEDKIKAGLLNFRPSGKRMAIFVNKNGAKIINDTYNANPYSMKAALDVLATQKGRKIAVLGDMFELGRSAKKEHELIGKMIPGLCIDVLLTSGTLSKNIYLSAVSINPGGKYFHFKDKNAIIRKLKHVISKGDIVLFKASRGMRFEKIAENFLT
ncbi:MAG: UDP-N-acetylmuramoyl-tripeptide--D-alanyl-D-alanine ligase [Candidatus Saganbacteria bacterium]|nr:UDP-N-acetylmuramoyl-tripeptide--D-alanyl-D-alanine ligase [Candidatus Saganbacteria bacterium]